MSGTKARSSDRRAVASATRARELTSGKDAGAYTVVAHYTSSDPKYTNADSAPVFFTIAPAPLSVTADDQMRTFGAPNPPLTVHYDGFVAGQGPGDLDGTVSVTTPATSASLVGTYALIPGGLTSANYVITFSTGTLTVTSAERRRTPSSSMARNTFMLLL